MCPCVIETPSILSNKSTVNSEIFGNPRKCSEMSGNDCLDFPQLLENLWKFTKVFGNLWKTVEKLLISLFVYIKKE